MLGVTVHLKTKTVSATIVNLQHWFSTWCPRTPRPGVLEGGLKGSPAKWLVGTIADPYRSVTQSGRFQLNCGCCCVEWGWKYNLYMGGAWPNANFGPLELKQKIVCLLGGSTVAVKFCFYLIHLYTLSTLGIWLCCTKRTCWHHSRVHSLTRV